MSKLEVNRKPNLNRREAFQAAASHLDATFVAGKLSYGDKIRLEHGPWRVILETHVVNSGQNPITYTRAPGFIRSEGRLHPLHFPQERVHANRRVPRLLRARDRRS